MDNPMNGNNGMAQPAVVFDFSQLLEITGDDSDLLNELLTSIIRQTGAILESMKQHINRLEFGALEAAAHKFKSTLQFFGENELLQLMRHIENDAPAQDIKQLEKMVNESQLFGAALITQSEKVLSAINR